MTDDELMSLGVNGALVYMLLKLVFEFLSQWRAHKASQNLTPGSSPPGVTQDQWAKFERRFEEHHDQDRQLLRVFERLEAAITVQTKVFEELLRRRD